MDYFKHYSSASNSKTINLIIDKFGLEGYAYWFLLLELCAENYEENSEAKFKFHVRIVRQKLRISLAKLELFLTFCREVSEVSFNFHGNLLEIDHPNLVKVKTTRSVIKSNKKQLVVYKEEDKEEDKDSEIKISTPVQKSDDLISVIQVSWNCAAEKFDFPKAKVISPKIKKDIQATVKIEEMKNVENWERYFDLLGTSDFLKGKNNRGWKANFKWAVKQESYSNVMNGEYGIGEKKFDLDDLGKLLAGAVASPPSVIPYKGDF